MNSTLLQIGLASSLFWVLTATAGEREQIESAEEVARFAVKQLALFPDFPKNLHILVSDEWRAEAGTENYYWFTFDTPEGPLEVELDYWFSSGMEPDALGITAPESFRSQTHFVVNGMPVKTRPSIMQMPITYRTELVKNKENIPLDDSYIHLINVNYKGGDAEGRDSRNILVARRMTPRPVAHAFLSTLARALQTSGVGAGLTTREIILSVMGEGESERACLPDILTTNRGVAGLFRAGLFRVHPLIKKLQQLDGTWFDDNDFE
jgi:hypothetical protein